MRLRQGRPGSSGVKDRDMEDTIQELEARVAMLESQKGALQNKLSLAKQHIMDLGGRTPYKFSKGVCSVKNIAHGQGENCFLFHLWLSSLSSSPCQVKVWNWRAESEGQHRLLRPATAPRWKTPGQRWRGCKCLVFFLFLSLCFFFYLHSLYSQTNPSVLIPPVPPHSTTLLFLSPLSNP